MRPGQVGPTERLQALLALPADASSRRLLVAALDDPSLEVVRAALRRLADEAEAEEAAAVRSRLLDCDLALVRDHALALRKLDPQGATELALRALDDSTYRRRLAGVVALEVLATDAEANALRRMLRDPVAAIRAAALRALRRLSPTSATAAACAPLLADTEATVRSEAVETLARHGERGLAILERTPLDPDPGVRRTLAHHADRLSLDHATLLLRDHDTHVRELAARAAGGGSLSRLAELLRGDPMPSVRLAAAKRLGELKRPAAIDALVTALRDPSSLVRAAALQSLELRLGRARAGRRLLQRLADPDPDMRTAFLYALARLEARGLDPAVLLPLARDPEPTVRVALAHVAASLLEDPEPIRSLLAHDHHPAVRAAAEKHSGQ